MLDKKEREVMRVIYEECIASGEDRVTLKPTQILAKMPLKLNFEPEELAPILKLLHLDGYFDYVEIEKKGTDMYFFELLQRGHAFKRELEQKKRKIKFKIYLGLIMLGFKIFGWLLYLIIS